MNLYTNLKVKFNNDFNKVENSEFVAGTALIAHTDKNRNYSDIPESAFETAMPSLALVPIVGHWIGEKQNFGGHDLTVEISAGQLIFKDNTVPYGVVKENHNAEWVEIEENGVMRKYLKVDVILWYGRYPEQVQKVIDTGVWQSMEINIGEYEEDGNYIKIKSFEYSALCLLGKDIDVDGKKGEDNVEPCFPNASVTVNKFMASDNFKEQYEKLIFSISQSQKNNSDINSGKEGGKQMDEKLELLAKYNLTVEDLDFDISEITLDELDVKLQEFTKQSDEPEEKLSFSATYNQKFKALDNALDPIIVKDDEGNYVSETYFYVCDFSDEYVFVAKTVWDANGYERTYGRFTYTFDESAVTASITSEFEKMITDVWLTQSEYDALMSEREAKQAEFEALKSEVETYKATITMLEAEKSELQEYKSDVETKIKQAEVDEVLSDFEAELGDNEEYIAIKDKALEYNIEDLQKELYALLGKVKYAKPTKQPKKQSFSSKVSVTSDSGSEKSGYYGSAEKYIPKK